jgi:penicillin-binding protein 2
MAKEYRVPIQEDVLAPEETLFDAGSEFSDLERPISAHVFRFMFWGVTALLIIIVGVTAKFSILDHAGYASLALQNRSSNFSMPAPRGSIVDSSGQTLAQNVPSFDLVAVSKEVKPILKDQTQLIATAKALNITADELAINITAQSGAASVFFVASDLTKDQVLAIEYVNPIGMYVVPDAKRVYSDGKVFSQIIGYIGKVNKDDLVKDSYYTFTDNIGRLGIEGQYEQYLRGNHGRIFFGSASTGQADATSTAVDATTGDSIVLNIDANLQRELYTQARNILASAGLSRGAAVIQNPQNGAVLAMVSFPTFNNNDFVDGLSQQQYQAIFNNSARPLFNRVISGLYNPGSTIKPLIGLMGLQEKIITPQTTIQDCVSITIPNPYDKTISYVYNNWRVDLGTFNLRRAIANSCNIFFFSVGGGFGKIIGLGADRIIHYLQSVFADHILGIDLIGEKSGFVPTPEWKEINRGQSWYQGDTYNISIGQGDLSVTPLWLNAYISAIANGGTIYQPQIASRIINTDGNVVKTIQPQVLTKMPFSDTNLAEVKNDMEETVISGTASIFKDLPVQVAAKTGTAEVVKGKSINSLFTVFAPADNPKISMTVLIEGSASNQGYALNIAHEVLKWYFAKTASQ